MSLGFFLFWLTRRAVLVQVIVCCSRGHSRGRSRSRTMAQPRTQWQWSESDKTRWWAGWSQRRSGLWDNQQWRENEWQGRSWGGEGVAAVAAGEDDD